MTSPTNRQPVWVTTLFEKHIKPTRLKFGNIPQGIPAVMCEDLLDSYINQLGVGVHEAVCLVSIYLYSYLLNIPLQLPHCKDASSEALALTNGAFQALNSARTLFEDMRKAGGKSPTLQLPADFSLLASITKRVHNYQNQQKAISSVPPLMPGSPAPPVHKEVSLLHSAYLLNLIIFSLIASQEACLQIQGDCRL